MTLVCGKEVKLPEDNPRDVFEYVKNHLLTQNKKCYGIVEYEDVGYEGCLYRSEDRTTACAAGSLIPDSQYHVCMENKPINDLPLSMRYIKTLDLIIILQSIHDGFEPDHWEYELDRLAEYITNED